MNDNGPTIRRKRGRPPKTVVGQHKEPKPSFNINHIIGHNIDTTDGNVADVDVNSVELTVEESRCHNDRGGGNFVEDSRDPRVGDSADVATATDKDSSPSLTVIEQKGGYCENPEKNKRGVTEDSGVTKRVMVTDYVGIDALKRGVEEYDEGSGEGMECYCAHCRAFGKRFAEEMRRYLGSVR